MLNLPEVKSPMPTSTISRPKFNFGWSSAPGPAGRAYSAPPNSLAGFKGACFYKGEERNEGEGRGGKGKAREEKEREWEEGRCGEGMEEEKRRGKGAPRPMLVPGRQIALLRHWLPVEISSNNCIHFNLQILVDDIDMQQVHVAGRVPGRNLL